jgi:hypothetical protein
MIFHFRLNIMNFRNKSYWLKIGIVGFLIGVLAIVILLLGHVSDALGMLGLVMALGSWGPWSGIIHVFCPDCSADTAGSIGIWLTPVTYFVYGAIIGFIFDKIWPRKQEINNI